MAADRRILYLMHVDWRWVRQRPQAMAEELARQCAVQVLYRLNPLRGSLVGNAGPMRRLPLLPLPSRFLGPLERVAQRAWITAVAAVFKPDLVWLTFPDLADCLPRSLARLPLVYDCMDDAPAFFAADPARQERVLGQEQRVVQRAALVLCSSAGLLARLRSRHPGLPRLLLARNGLDSAFLDLAPPPPRPALGHRPFEAIYFGTVSHWLDFEAVRLALERLPQLRLHLIGPREAEPPFAHERLVLRDPVEHAALPALAREADAFVMPFRPGPLIECVDPVKLYEYLALGREVAALGYPEVERFAPFAHLYQGAEGLAAVLGALANGRAAPRNLPERVRPFLARNTWQERGRTVLAALEELRA